MDHEQALFRLFGKFCPEGTILYKAGEPGEEMFIVQSGAVRIGRTGPEGPVWRTLGAEEILGEESFFSRAPRAFRAEVLKDSRLLQVSERNLNSVVRIGPEAALRLVGTLLEGTSSAWGELEAWTMGHVLRRAEPYLLQKGATALQAGQIADQSGCDWHDALRLLLQLERRGGVRREGELFRIEERSRLEGAVRELAASLAPVSSGSSP